MVVAVDQAGDEPLADHIEGAGLARDGGRSLARAKALDTPVQYHDNRVGQGVGSRPIYEGATPEDERLSLIGGIDARRHSAFDSQISSLPCSTIVSPSRTSVAKLIVQSLWAMARMAPPR